MGGNYAPDTFTESDVLACLEAAGKKYKRSSGRYILAQCPLHDDEHESAQIYRDDWFVKCHAGCEGGRFHIAKAYPELRNNNQHSPRQQSVSRPVEKKVSDRQYKTYDLMDSWQQMPLIPRDHYFKNIDLETLDELGWRWVPDYNQYFIPYFSASKQSIPFAQYRNLDNDKPRFIMLKDAKPTCYGTWNLDNHKLFVVEGASDGAVLEHCSVPWIALPSAASSELMKALAGYCKENGIELIYAGDNDSAGEKLRQALDEVMPYRVKQPRQPYKDWGDMYEAEGIESVQEYCFRELFPNNLAVASVVHEHNKPVEVVENKTPLEQIQEVFPGAEQLTLVADPPKSKEQSGKSAVLY